MHFASLVKNIYLKNKVHNIFGKWPVGAAQDSQPAEVWGIFIVRAKISHIISMTCLVTGFSGK